MSYAGFVMSMLKQNEVLSYFGRHKQIQLSETNIIYIILANGIEKTLPFGVFKRNITWYSEFTNTHCAALLPMIEDQANTNAGASGFRGKKARANLDMN